jgi:hypothetical protein
MLSELPEAKGPVWRSPESVAGGLLKSIFDMSYRSVTPPCAAEAAAWVWIVAVADAT